MNTVILVVAVIQLIVLAGINAHVLWSLVKKDLVLRRPVILVALIFCGLHSTIYFMLGSHLGMNVLYILASAYLMTFGIIGNTLRHARA